MWPSINDVNHAVINKIINSCCISTFSVLESPGKSLTTEVQQVFFFHAVNTSCNIEGLPVINQVKMPKT